MILSMTGYGSAQLARDGVCYAIEVRTVNNRYLKLSIKLPEHLQFAEASIDKLLRKRIIRGTVSFSLRVRSDGAPVSRVINMAALQSHVDQLGSINAGENAKTTIDLATLATLPGISEAPEFDESQRDAQLAVITNVANGALDALVAMRQEEGKALRADLEDNIAQVRAELKNVSSRAPLVVSDYNERLKSRVAQLLQSAKLNLDQESLMREVAVFADRCDISEELSRLDSHMDQFGDLCGRGEQVGRTLDFLTQEMLREANTIGSKANDGDIARSVVLIKGLIDRLKEQVQNAE